MRSSIRCAASLFLILVLLASATRHAAAQRRPSRAIANQPARQTNRANQSQQQPANLPTDPRLLKLHKQFVAAAEKLAGEYERSGDTDRAQSVYREILKLVPGYPPAEKKLEEIRKFELTARKTIVEVHANRSWQDTGVDLIEGKPVRFTAAGKWTFTLSGEMKAEGAKLPKEFRQFPVGALVAVIAEKGEKDPRPFLIGNSLALVAGKSGRLYLRMHDSQHSDNKGSLSVEIQGTFKEEKPKPTF